MPVPSDNEQTPAATATTPAGPATAAAVDRAAELLDGGSLAGLISPVGNDEVSDQRHMVIASQRPRFLHRFQPGLASWEVAAEGLQKPTLLPILSTQLLSVGVGGIRTRAANEPAAASYRMAMYRAMEKGFIYLVEEGVKLPDELIPPAVLAAARSEGKAHVGYLVKTRARLPGPVSPIVDHYMECWEVPAIGGYAAPGQVTRVRFDRARYNQYRLWLIKSGRVPLPQPGELDTRRADIMRAFTIAQNSVGPTEARKRVMGDAKESLAAFDAAFAALESL